MSDESDRATDRTSNRQTADTRLCRFERWQVGLGIVQIIVGTITICAAVWIGLQQNSINQQLYDLNFNPSLDITYSDTRINVLNKGKENIWLWGAKVGSEKSKIESYGRLITPSGSYYMIGDKLESLISTSLSKATEVHIPAQLFIVAGNGRRYIVEVLIYGLSKDGKIEIHMQTLAIRAVKEGWPQ